MGDVCDGDADGDGRLTQGVGGGQWLFNSGSRDGKWWINSARRGGGGGLTIRFSGANWWINSGGYGWGEVVCGCGTEIGDVCYNDDGGRRLIHGVRVEIVMLTQGGR